MTDQQALLMAIEAVKKVRHPYAVRCSGSSMLFEFGINAKKHYDKYTEALTHLEAMRIEKEQPRLL